ncbi:alpha/beta hydrolase family protein [Pontibacter silvestris]|uniref:Alpha/beta hydrolase family protein n=2 Tax=Pontibacter silvestris TaxID=2305183 RepID=A0ABW4X479_9BACT
MMKLSSNMILFLLTVVLVLLAFVHKELLRDKFVIPAPTGAYRVGYQERVLMDSARVASTSSSGYRNLIVSLYYPTTECEGESVSYLSPESPVVHNLAQVLGLPEKSLKHIAEGKTHSYLNAPVADVDELPVVLFSHSINGMRGQNTYLVEELASHGYLVASIEHDGYSIGSVFPDGVVGDFLKHDVLQDVSAGGEIIDLWSEDQLFVYEQLQQLNNKGKLFSRQINLGKAGLVGHAFGGAASFNTVTVSDVFESAVNLDGFYFGENYTKGTYKPLLEIRAEPRPAEEMKPRQLEQVGMSRQEYQTMMFDEWNRRINYYAKGVIYRYALHGAKHLSFTDLVLAVPFKRLLLGDCKYYHNETRVLVKAFFDHTLKGASFGLIGSSSLAEPIHAVSA